MDQGRVSGLGSKGPTQWPLYGARALTRVDDAMRRAPFHHAAHNAGMLGHRNTRGRTALDSRGIPLHLQCFVLVDAPITRVRRGLVVYRFNDTLIHVERRRPSLILCWTLIFVMKTVARLPSPRRAPTSRHEPCICDRTKCFRPRFMYDGVVIQLAGPWIRLQFAIEL
jgi:hypothetical protein